MYTVSDRFKNYLKSSGRELEAKVVIDGVLELGTDAVVEFNIEDAVTDADEFVLGSVVSSRFDLKLKTSERIPNNAKIQPYIRMNGDSGYTEWLPLGVFYVDSRVEKNTVWDFVCYDKLIVAQKDYKTGLNYPANMRNVLNELAMLMDMEIDSSLEIKDYIIRTKPDGYTIREILSLIALSNVSAVRLNREGRLTFVDLSNRTIRETLTMKDYVRCDITNPLKTYTKLVANYGSDIEESSIGQGEADNTLYFYNPYLTEQMLSDMYNVLLGMEYMPVSMTWAGRPDLDAGDWVNVILRDGRTISTPLLTNKISYKGGLAQESTAPSFSPQQSEFGFEGEQSRSVKQLEKRIGVYVSVLNEDPIKVGQNLQSKLVLPIATLGQTTIEFTVIIIGQASVDSTLTLELSGELDVIIPTFKTFVKKGWNTLNISYLARDIPETAANIRLMLAVEIGAFDVDTQKVQFYAYGANLIGDSGVPYASVSDYIERIDDYLSDVTTVKFLPILRINIEDDIEELDVITDSLCEAYLDAEPPVLHYDGERSFELSVGDSFEVPEVTVTDDADENIQVVVTITDYEGNEVDYINTDTQGQYTVVYTARDKAGNEAEPIVVQVIVIEVSII